MWVYYSAQILFFGDELTQGVASRRQARGPITAAPREVYSAPRAAHPAAAGAGLR